MAPWLITWIIILINSFFVAAELALVKIRDSQIDIMIKRGSSVGSLIKILKDKIDLTLSSVQLGVTLSGLALWWIGESSFYQWFLWLFSYFDIFLPSHIIHIFALIATFMFISSLTIVIGELLPKWIAIRYPIETASIIARPLILFSTIFKPFIRFLQKSSKFVLNIFGIKSINEDESHSEEELRMIVTESEEDGLINASERELIHNVFDFDNKDVSEIMTPTHKIFAISAKDRNDEMIQKIFEEWYSRIPVYQDTINNIVGWVLVKDIVTKMVKKKEILLHELMRPMYFVPDNQKIIDCLRELQRQHMQLAMVISEYGTTIGLVTMEDILEELVGDIHDEHDEQQHIVNKIDDYYLIDTSATIQDVNEILPLNLPESEDYDTISWMINYLYGRIPSLGEVYETDLRTFTITKRKKQRIEQIKFTIKE
jgi:CBS domain containing-hemolysin-like protein